MSDINNSLIYTAPSISQRAAIQALAIRQTIREKYVLAYRDRIFYAADRMRPDPLPQSGTAQGHLLPLPRH